MGEVEQHAEGSPELTKDVLGWKPVWSVCQVGCRLLKVEPSRLIESEQPDDGHVQGIQNSECSREIIEFLCCRFILKESEVQMKRSGLAFPK